MVGSLNYPPEFFPGDFLWSKSSYLFPSILLECIRFSLYVHHSNSLALLSYFIHFLWFTQGLFSGFDMNVSATRRWIHVLSFRSLDHRNTLRYHFCNLGKSICFNTLLHTIQFSLTSYNFSHPGISFQTSFIFCWLKVFHGQYVFFVIKSS